MYMVCNFKCIKNAVFFSEKWKFLYIRLWGALRLQLDSPQTAWTYLAKACFPKLQNSILKKVWILFLLHCLIMNNCK